MGRISVLGPHEYMGYFVGNYGTQNAVVHILGTVVLVIDTAEYADWEGCNKISVLNTVYLPMRYNYLTLLFYFSEEFYRLKYILFARNANFDK